MQNLIGCFVREDPAETLGDHVMFPFALVYAGSKIKKYYAETKDQCHKWIDLIRKAVGYANLLDYYELKVRGKFIRNIGSTRQGQVRYCPCRYPQENGKACGHKSDEEVRNDSTRR